MAGNRNLNSAAKAKNDEFYTQKSDIENELKNYTHFFRDKIIFCNCDDPYESKFFQYFAEKFNFLGLKKLIATNFVGSPVFQTVLNFEGTPNQIPDFDKKKHAIKVEISEVPHDDEKGFSMSDLEFLLTNTKNILTQLNGDSKFPAGDFRSAECVELLQQADIVVTNPPFSLFREYVKQLFQFNKKFIIIGNQNAVTYKEIFPLIMQNKMWLGYGFRGNVGFFYSHYEDIAKSSQHRDGMIRVSGVYWFTNLDVKKRHEILPLVFSYAEHPEKYPHYDNYDAIEVSKTAEIPGDYDGVMGVPITFLDKYNPEQFEIVGNAGSYGVDGYSLCAELFINGKKIYKRILIRRR